MSSKSSGAKAAAKPADPLAATIARALLVIESSDDPDRLRQLMRNARDRDAPTVYDAAFRRLAAILPDEAPGTLEHDFWQTIHSFEQVLAEDRGKTVRLSRTRLKVAKVGVAQTLTDWAAGRDETDGFRMLIERGLTDLTGEAIVIRHAGAFAPEVVAAAQARLDAVAVAA